MRNIIIVFMVILIISSCVPNKNIPDNISEEKYCERDSDCACGVHIKDGNCFHGNKKFVDADPRKACPDFCGGIAGNLRSRCINNRCSQSE